jgi:outer membrane murein-binding lipoprotein Lpp
MTETEQYHAQAIDELTAKMDRLENQVEFLTKHIQLMNGVHNKEFRSMDQVFDKIFAMENKQ